VDAGLGGRREGVASRASRIVAHAVE
jgi:hypothetical protein